MVEKIHSYTDEVVSKSGVRYRVHAYGAPTDFGTWKGWLLFEPLDGGPSLQTDQETTQPNRAALEYWASGVEPIYLDGALGRAVPL
jgi:hypothetical protein